VATLIYVSGPGSSRGALALALIGGEIASQHASKLSCQRPLSRSCSARRRTAPVASNSGLKSKTQQHLLCNARQTRSGIDARGRTCPCGAGTVHSTLSS
jgi:hypothetical protein